MYRRCLPFLLMFLTLGPAAAQEGLPWANKIFTGKEEAPPPLIVHDFGTVPKGTVRTHRFNMTNIYAVPMQLMEPKPSCGCVSVLAYTDKMESKETGQIDIKIDTSRVEGVKVVRLPVVIVGTHPKSGERFQSIAQLEIRAVSRPDIFMNPGAFAFGVNPAGAKNTQSVTVTYNGRMKGWTITEVGYKKELFDVTVKPLDNKSGTMSYLVSATMKEGMPVGSFDDQIVLKTNDPAAPALMVNVTGTVQASLTLVPDNVMKIGNIEIGKKLEKRYLLKADKLFRIASVDGDGDGVTVSLPPVTAAKTQAVIVLFQPEKPGAVKKTLTIKTDAGESIQLTVEGKGTLPVAPPTDPNP
ncbi:DUF1573 domain-containing protein [Zavarzinella formosa]|uniref:DUF1573 domain-containing protein n=1 Tax=Zavarzinella formosa TaxID=360055 RepID=UPI0012F7A08F|nr:DUF1573 domain-containing protein [Zavarzinella formosa]